MFGSGAITREKGKKEKEKKINHLTSILGSQHVGSECGDWQVLTYDGNGYALEVLI